MSSAPLTNRIAAAIYVLSVIGCLFASAREWRKFARKEYFPEDVGLLLFLFFGLSGVPGINTILLAAHLLWLRSENCSKTPTPTGEKE